METNSSIQGVIPVSYVGLLYDYLSSQSVNATTLLGPQPQIKTGLERIPATQWCQLLNTAAEHLQDPMLGLHLGQTISAKHLGVLGYVLLACGTLGGALARLEQYHRLVYDINPLHLRTDQQAIHLEWGQSMGRPGPLADETAITALVQFARDITDYDKQRPHTELLEVAFINPQPSNTSTYQDWFGCPVLFEQTTTRVSISADWLNTPLRSADPALIEVLERQAKQLLAQLPQAQTPTVNWLQNFVAEQLMQTAPNAEQAAAALNISSRSLHRRLAQEGDSFSGVLQRCRQELAYQYLDDQRLQLAEIAQLLGYSEQSAFTRAFKHWTGLLPLQYRKNRNRRVARSPD